MNAVLLSAVIVGALGRILLFFALRARAKRGLGPGETVALDNVTLYSPRLNLVGRPDRIVKCADGYIPEEWKSSRRVNHGHRLQLGTYFLLIEEEYGVRPRTVSWCSGTAPASRCRTRRPCERRCCRSRRRSASGGPY